MYVLQLLTNMHRMWKPALIYLLLCVSSLFGNSR